MGEIYAGNFRRTYGLETVCLRYFNVYGPRQVTEGAYRLVIGIFMDQQKRGEPLTIHGDGLQTRDFTWVGDVVRANILAGESERVGAGEPINVGAGSEVSINRIAELVGGPVVHTEPRGFDERFKRAGIQRARDLLGWEPTVQIEEGIQRLLAIPLSPWVTADVRAPRVLMLAHGFPPAGGSGSNRALAFARYLPGLWLAADGAHAGCRVGREPRRSPCAGDSQGPEGHSNAIPGANTSASLPSRR